MWDFTVSRSPSLIQFECLNIRIGHELCKNTYPRFICAHNSVVVVVWLAVWGTEISRQVWSTAHPLQAAGLYRKRQKD